MFKNRVFYFEYIKNIFLKVLYIFLITEYTE